MNVEKGQRVSYCNTNMEIYDPYLHILTEYFAVIIEHGNFR